MRSSIFHALGAPGDLANYGARMKNTSEYWTTHPGLAHEKSMDSLWLFSEEVMPRFTNQPALAGTK